METARLTTWSPCWSPSSRVLTSMPLAPPETISCQKLISGEMSGASFWFLPMNFVRGSVEYRPLSDAVPFSVNELFHFSVPSNAAVEPCATKGMETRRSPQAKRMRLAIERTSKRNYRRSMVVGIPIQMEEGPSKFILNVSWTYDPTNAKKHVPLWISAGSSVATVFPPRQPCATVRETCLPVPDRWWFRSRIPLRSCSLCDGAQCHGRESDRRNTAR